MTPAADRNRSKLRTVGITHILVCAQELPCVLANDPTLSYCSLQMADNPGQAQHYSLSCDVCIFIVCLCCKTPPVVAYTAVLCCMRVPMQVLPITKALDFIDSAKAVGGHCLLHCAGVA